MPIIRHPETPLMVPRQVFEDWRLPPQARWILAELYAGTIDSVKSDVLGERYGASDFAPSPDSLQWSCLALFRIGYLVQVEGSNDATLADPWDIKIPPKPTLNAEREINDVPQAD